MPTRIRFDFWGDTQIDRTLARVELGATDARPAWERIYQMFLRAESRQFASEGRYGSGGWAPLSPRYAAWKARHYPGRPILVREGDLKDSLTKRGAPGGVLILEPHLLIMGSSVRHGQYHQAGGPNLPRRRPVELPESLRRNMVRVLQRWLVTGTLD